MGQPLFYCQFYLCLAQGSVSYQQKGERNPMATHSLVKLRQLWKQEELTVEQMLGHLLQHVETLEEQMQTLQKEVRPLQQEHKA